MTVADPTIAVGNRFRSEVRRHKVNTLRATRTLVDSASARTLLDLIVKL